MCNRLTAVEALKFYSSPPPNFNSELLPSELEVGFQRTPVVICVGRRADLDQKSFDHFDHSTASDLFRQATHKTPETSRTLVPTDPRPHKHALDTIICRQERNLPDQCMIA